MRELLPFGDRWHAQMLDLRQVEAEMLRDQRTEGRPVSHLERLHLLRKAGEP